MNANELAELIEHLENAKYVGASKAATMLRQQAEQINNLQQWEKRQLDVIEAQKEKLTKYELRHAEQRKRIEELEEKCLALKELGIIGAVTSGKKIEGGIVAEPRMLIKFIEDAYNK